MKKLLLFTLSVFLLNVSGLAQNDVTLTINHKLGDADFAMNQAATNNLGDDFNVSRLEYYISEISIKHDGGNETAIEDTWILVNATQTTQVSLGNHDITEVEAINFHIGVDSAHNHLDPAGYPGSHPLAPQNPSMHWGWAAGYRFLAMEGKGGSNLNQTYELHGLEDDNYFQTTIDLTATAANNEINIGLDADYTRVLENIAVNAGLIVHGGYGEAKQALENFRDYVFSPASSTTSVLDFEDITSFEIFPNPSSNGTTTLKIETVQPAHFDVVITNTLGNRISYFKGISNNTSLDLQIENTGLYFVSLLKNGQTIITKKLILN